MQKIDVFAHILPANFVKSIHKKIPGIIASTALSSRRRPGVRDLDCVFRSKKARLSEQIGRPFGVKEPPFRSKPATP
jgi:hypothetical protein